MLAYIIPVLLMVASGTCPNGSVKTGSLTVLRTTLDGEEPFVVTVQLYRGGELIRTRELLKYQPSLSSATSTLVGESTALAKSRDRHEVTWDRLPEGTYVVCFEAKGYMPSFKTVRVVAEDRDENQIYVEMEPERRPGATPREKKKAGKGPR